VTTDELATSEPAESLAADIIVDARGQLCPMPIVMLNRQMRDAAVGTVVKLLATDRGAKADVPAWADDTENELISAGEEQGILVFWLRKSAIAA
jgi:TusA-related sulfurtransferase